MAHKTLINGTAYEIKGGKTLIGGTAYGIASGKTLVGGTGYDVSFEKKFVDCTWAEIIQACQTKTVPESWAIGDSKPMTINGTDYTIDIIGKNHDTYTAGGTAPLTFQLHELYNTKYTMNNSDTNSGGYDNSAMHTTHLPAIKNLMPSEVKAAIKPVNKKASAGSQSTTIETISCYLFVLSEVEVLGTTSRSVAGEGSRYEYYQGAVAGSAGNIMNKYLSGTLSTWWLRSPYKSNATSFCGILPGGSVGYPKASTTQGVSFAFCF